MKLSKKILAAFSAAAMLVLAGSFVACADEEGEGDSDGSKWNRMITVDGTDTTKVPAGSYSRYWSQLGSKEKIAGIVTTIKIDKTQSTLEANDKRAVVGYMFDYLQSSDTGSTKDNRQFCLLGVQPAKNRFYLEHYSNVKKGEDSYVTTDSSLGAYTSFKSDTWSSTQIDDDWNALPTGCYTDSTSEYSFAIGIFPMGAEETEAAAKASTDTCYIVVIGKDADAVKAWWAAEDESTVTGVKEVGYYNGSNIGSFKYTDPDTKKSVTLYSCVGGVCAYANAPSGTKVVATYTTGKTSGEDYVGSLFDETVEE